MELGISYTLRCNIECRHCSVSSGPELGEKLTLDQGLDSIAQAVATGRFQRVIFTGGEVTLYPRELIPMIEAAHAAGLETRIVTNASWATSREKGRRFLARFREAGLSDLNVSAGRYHQEFVPAERVGHALAAARDHGLLRILCQVVPDPEAWDVAAFARTYGLDAAECVLVSEMAPQEILKVKEPGHPGRVEYLDRILIRNTALSPIGRAARYPSEWNLQPLEDFAPVGCPEPGVRPVVSHDGRLLPCCSLPAYQETFAIGDLGQRSMTDLLAEADADPVLAYIRDVGPAGLVGALKDRGHDLPDDYGDICHMCQEVFSRLTRPEIAAAVEADRARAFLTHLFAPALGGDS